MIFLAYIIGSLALACGCGLVFLSLLDLELEERDGTDGSADGL